MVLGEPGLVVVELGVEGAAHVVLRRPVGNLSADQRHLDLHVDRDVVGGGVAVGRSAILPERCSGAPDTSTSNVPVQEPSAAGCQTSVWRIAFVGFSTFLAKPGRSTVTTRDDMIRMPPSWSAHSSFNLIDTAHGLKVDPFVLGEGLLDRMQIERRIKITISGVADGLWVTSPEDQVLRKLDWYRSSGHESERQWRDVVGILRVHGDAMDIGYLDGTARELDLQSLLDEATHAANVD